jgi:taurine dioxygenase
MDQTTGLDIVYADAPLGHEIRGVDLSQPLPDRLFEEIERTFDRYGVVVISGQRLTPQQQIDFSKRLGTLERYPIDTYLLPGHPEIFVVSNVIENGRAIGMADAGRVWHTDMHYTASPPRCSLLYALEVPMRDGQPLGDTLFASTAAAYDGLPPDLKALVTGKRAVNSYQNYVTRRKSKVAGGTPTAQGERNKRAEAFPDVLHPLVRTHPRTGRKCLYVSDEVTCGVEGMGAAEGAQLLEDLLDHMTKPQYVYRHRWRVGDLIIWDNCSAIHNAIGDYTLAERRRMHRTTVTGGPTF